MKFYIYNTDRDGIAELPKPRYSVLIAGRFAAVSGDYEKYGMQLAQLKPGDRLLMYENTVGVVAIGIVEENWDGEKHAIPKYYTKKETSSFDADSFEYRIAVEWDVDLSQKPITIDHLRSILKSPKFVPRGTVKVIKTQHDLLLDMMAEIFTLKHVG